MDELQNVCGDIHQKIHQPLSFLKVPSLPDSSECQLTINISQNNSISGMKLSFSSASQFVVYFGEVKSGLKLLPSRYGKLINLKYENSVLMIIAQPEEIHRFFSREIRQVSWNVFPIVTILVGEQGFLKLCQWCYQTSEDHIIHWWEPHSIPAISMMIGRIFSRKIYLKWFAFVAFSETPTRVYTNRHFR